MGEVGGEHAHDRLFIGKLTQPARGSFSIASESFANSIDDSLDCARRTGQSEVGNNLLGEFLLHSLLFFNGYVGVHGDLERDIAFLDDEADIVAHGQEISIIPDAADRRLGNRFHLTALLPALVSVKILQHERDVSAAARSSIPGARLLERWRHVCARSHRDAQRCAHLGLTEK
jgi:hypothetical protein